MDGGRERAALSGRRVAGDAAGARRATLIVTTSAAAAAELVVVEARGVSLKQGDVLDDAKPIKLEDGQLLTLVAESGSILTLRGPYDQTPAA